MIVNGLHTNDVQCSNENMIDCFKLHTHTQTQRTNINMHLSIRVYCSSVQTLLINEMNSVEMECVWNELPFWHEKYFGVWRIFACTSSICHSGFYSLCFFHRLYCLLLLALLGGSLTVKPCAMDVWNKSDANWFPSSNDKTWHRIVICLRKQPCVNTLFSNSEHR